MKKPGSYFKKNGTFCIPDSTPWPSDFKPPLDCRAWIFWVVVWAKDYPGNSKKYIEGIGSLSTRGRLKKHLHFRDLF